VAARRHRQGFTLIELMVALAIAAMLILLGLPSFTTFLRNSEIRSTSESIINGLRAATTEAANRNRPVTFSLKGNGAAWTGWEITFLDDDDKPQTIQQYSKKEAGANTTVTVSQGAASVIFDGLGRITNAGTDDHIRTIEIESIASGEARPLRIIVDDPAKADPTKPRGLRMCDPDKALADLNDPRAC
jgi:type IV fimbrial biogenesis protein FimT